MLEFLIPMPSFRSRSRLFYLFRLCCLCITESHQELPAIKFHDVDTSSPSCRLSAVILPAQSYLSNCPDAIATCTTETALAQYRELEGQFSSRHFAGDPWVHADMFGRAEILKNLSIFFKRLKAFLLSASVLLHARPLYLLLLYGKLIGLQAKHRNLPISVISLLMNYQRQCKSCERAHLKTNCTYCTLSL